VLFVRDGFLEFVSDISLQRKMVKKAGNASSADVTTQAALATLSGALGEWEFYILAFGSTCFL
jgi:hypothetical protein